MRARSLGSPLGKVLIALAIMGFVVFFITKDATLSFVESQFAAANAIVCNGGIYRIDISANDQVTIKKIGSSSRDCEPRKGKGACAVNTYVRGALAQTNCVAKGQAFQADASAGFSRGSTGGGSGGDTSWMRRIFGPGPDSSIIGGGSGSGGVVVNQQPATGWNLFDVWGSGGGFSGARSPSNTGPGPGMCTTGTSGVYVNCSQLTVPN